MRGIDTSALITVLNTFGLVRTALLLHRAAWGASTSYGSSPVLPLRMLCSLPHSSALWGVPCLSQALLGRPYLAYLAAHTLGAPSAASGHVRALICEMELNGWIIAGAFPGHLFEHVSSMKGAYGVNPQSLFSCL